MDEDFHILHQEVIQTLVVEVGVLQRVEVTVVHQQEGQVELVQQLQYLEVQQLTLVVEVVVVKELMVGLEDLEAVLLESGVDVDKQEMQRQQTLAEAVVELDGDIQVHLVVEVPQEQVVLVVQELLLFVTNFNSYE